MEEKKLLATFEAAGDTFNIYGSYECGTNKDKNKNEYTYPEFYDLTAKKVIDGEEVDYEPKGSTWAGRKYTVEDMIQDFIAKLTVNNSSYSAIFIESGLQDIINQFNNAEAIALTVDNLQIPKAIMSYDLYNIYELVLVTNDFIYYVYDEMIIMFTTNTHGIVSDNYFAEVGFWESVENIKSGKEILLWGELPKVY